MTAWTDHRTFLRRAVRRPAPGGVFPTITTLTALPTRVRGLRRSLEATFGEVAATEPVWRNVPPSRLFVCRGPRAC